MGPDLAIWHERWNTVAPLVASLIVASVVMTGLVWIGVQNLRSGAVARHLHPDHGIAVHKLFFRDVE